MCVCVFVREIEREIEKIDRLRKRKTKRKMDGKEILAMLLET